MLNIEYIRDWQKKHPEKMREYQQRWRLKHSEKNQQSHQKYRDNNKEKIRNYQQNNRSKFRKSNKKHNHRNRQIVLEHYGGKPPKCANCGCSVIDCLDIDHINNNGAEERERHGSGTRFVKWLIGNGFPPGYQILCRNCNWLKYIKLLRQ